MKNIQIVREYRSGVTFTEALRLVGDHRMLSCKTADELLQDEEAYKKYSALFTCWTGTMLVYEAPGVPFGKYVKDSVTGWIFDVPGEFQGKVDIALLLEHPDFKIEEGAYGMTFVRPAPLYQISSMPFPKVDGWYLPNEFGIPTGDEVSRSNKDARYLSRRSEATLRPVVRWDYDFGYRRVVGCVYGPDGYGLGVGYVEPQATEDKPAAAKKRSKKAVEAKQ